MVFSSAVFLILFLPLVLLGYYIPFRKSRKYKNVFLFLASVAFYAYGEPIYVVLLLGSICMNWFLGNFVGRDDIQEKKRKSILATGIFLNVALLFVFKYLDFVIENVNAVCGKEVLATVGFALPIGISFYTFQAISYLIDVYRQKAMAQKNILNVGLYIALFPQLVAGPIVRYDTIAKEIHERKENFEDAYHGIHRFIKGLGKKVLLADMLAVVADRAYSLPFADLSMSMAWLGALSYTLQIYYDFSAYSDMAIGLGRMFGFHFMENFQFPYISKSITEFWRRWHISLGSWFRDYVYIPLGGNRRGKIRQICNLLIVWSLTGLWHGANWTFVAWGLLQFIVLLIEKLTGYAGSEKWFGRIYVLPVILFGWTLFRAESFEVAVSYIGAMFGANGMLHDTMTMAYLTSYLVVLVCALWLCVPHKKIRNLFEKKMPQSACCAVVELGYFAVLVVAFAFIIRSSYSPFIYFNF